MSEQNKTLERRVNSGIIDVGSTKLYHEVRGSGPALLLITGGTGDAGEWGHVAPALAEEFTVVTYDRRGLSRSPRPDSSTVISVDEHADDAAALLRALGLTPAVVVGHSGGASIACALVARHPEVVRHAVSYEPPLLAVVPNGQAVVGGFQAMVEQAMAEGGPRRALEAFIRANAGAEVYELWLASIGSALRERIFGNAATFFSIELPAFATFIPDRERMRSSGVSLTVVVGEENRDTWYGAAASWLADGTGANLIELPGGHGGFVSHPEAFVELVRRVARPDEGSLRTTQKRIIMSEQNKMLMRRAVEEVWNQGNVDALEELVASDFVIHRIANGKVVECWTSTDDLGLLQQLGVVPAPEHAG